MSEGAWVALGGGGISVIGVALTVWGSRFVAKVSAKAQLKSVELEESKVRAGAYAEARESYRELVADLRKEISGVRAAQEEDRARHRQELTEQDERQRKQIAELREERREQLTALNERLDEMEAQRDNDRRLIEALTAYIRQLLRLLKDREIVPPPAPQGMRFDD